MTDSEPDLRSAALRLLSSAAVRERAGRILEAGLAGGLAHFAVRPERLGDAAEAVVATIRDAYPTLRVPFHSRWRHFAAAGLDRWGSLDEATRWKDVRARGRAAFDLAVASVLLDAGAGPTWRYEEGRTGETFSRSEGLAVASFDMFLGGAFSGRPEDPLRADGAALASLEPDELAAGFQAGPDNPLVGLEGRTELLRRLGRAVTASPEVFGSRDDPRPGPSSTTWSASRPASASRRPRSWRRCSSISARSGPDAPRSAGWISATRGGIRQSARRTARTGSFPSTSSRNGSPTRSSSRWRRRASGSSTSTA